MQVSWERVARTRDILVHECIFFNDIVENSSAVLVHYEDLPLRKELGAAHELSVVAAYVVFGCMVDSAQYDYSRMSV